MQKRVLFAKNSSTIRGIMVLYPLKFHPVYKDYLWGGRNLERLGKKLPDGIVAESWEVSAHPDGVSLITNGEYAGSTLPDYLRRFGRAAIGSALPEAYAQQFPLLIKLIDANQKLSVQVHPDDLYAQSHEGGYGKNEMWYIISAEPGSRIIYDVKPGVSRDSLAQAVRENRIADCLQTVPVSAGDAFNIPAGKVHGLGAGIVLAEIQQSSNLTYRLYDYDRTDAAGHKRPLHIDKGLDVIDFAAAGRDPKIKGQRFSLGQAGVKELLVANRYFGVELYDLDGELGETTAGERFFIYTFISGTGEIRYAGGVLPIEPAESVFIPAGLGDFIVAGQLKYLKSYVPNQL
jgi:mannose-6-phosphate isomerase